MKVTNAEELAFALNLNPMTREEITQWLSERAGRPVGKAYAKEVIKEMRRKVLPEIDGWCPRPTYPDYQYAVVNKRPNASEIAITEKGADVFISDSMTRLQTMLRTSDAYMKALPANSRRLGNATLIHQGCQLALSSLEFAQEPRGG